MFGVDGANSAGADYEVVDVGAGLADRESVENSPLGREPAENPANLDLALGAAVPGEAVGGQRGDSPEPGETCARWHRQVTTTVSWVASTLSTRVESLSFASLTAMVRRGRF